MQNQGPAAGAELSGAALIKYQADAGLVADGVLGPVTRAALIADEMATHVSDLIGFRGSLGCIIECEGFRGRPYVPRGSAGSGVTLDFGFDLGQQTHADFYRLYGHLWAGQESEWLATAIGWRGVNAQQWLKEHDAARWPITREQAAQILPRAAGPYWGAAVRACPALRDAPARVQTALLSLTYSAWTGPVELMRLAIDRGDWAHVAETTRKIKGAKARREWEAGLIESCSG